MNTLRSYIFLKKNKIISIILWGLFLLVLLSFIEQAINTLPFSFDSWTYWELSKTIFSSDFYKIHGWRQFQVVTEFSMSFPPLWPISIAFFEVFFPLGPATMPLLAGLSFIVGVWVLEKLFKQSFNSQYLGIASGFLLLGFPPFVEEITAGRSIPLVFMLLSIMLFLWFKPMGNLNTIKLGVIAGLLILTRFDMLAFTVVFGLAIYIKQIIIGIKSQRLKPIFLFYFVLLLMISPYIFYSWIHFAKIFATDNSMVAQSAKQIFVTYFSTQPVVTLFEQPLVWLDRVSHNMAKLLEQEKKLLLLSLLGFVLSFISIKLKFNEEKIKLLLLFFVFYLVSLSSYVLTGYFDKRYFSILVFFSFILLFLFLHQHGFYQPFFQSQSYLKSITFLFSLVITMIIFSIAGIVSFSQYNIPKFNVRLISDKDRIKERQLDKIPLCSSGFSAEDKILFEKGEDGVLVAASLNVNTTILPYNLDKEMYAFLSLYKVKAFYGDNINTLKIENRYLFESCNFDSKFIFLKEKK